jgi:hypothetical protein
VKALKPTSSVDQPFQPARTDDLDGSSCTRVAFIQWMYGFKGKPFTAREHTKLYGRIVAHSAAGLCKWTTGEFGAKILDNFEHSTCLVTDTGVVLVKSGVDAGRSKIPETLLRLKEMFSVAATATSSSSSASASAGSSGALAAAAEATDVTEDCALCADIEIDGVATATQQCCFCLLHVHEECARLGCGGVFSKEVLSSCDGLIATLARDDKLPVQLRHTRSLCAMCADAIARGMNVMTEGTLLVD